MDSVTLESVSSGGTVAEAIRAFTLLGGEWVLWLLVFLSVLSVTVMIERAIYFTRNRTTIAAFLQGLSERLARDDIRKAEALADVTKGAEARIAGVGLRHFPRGERVVEDMMASQAVAERVQFERYLMVLGTIGNNAPFIGLFGTVLGIIKAFHDLALAGGSTSGATAVMAGISEALVATAMGLLVAIPAVIAYNFFTKKVREYAANAETVERILLAHLKYTPGDEKELQRASASA